MKHWSENQEDRRSDLSLRGPVTQMPSGGAWPWPRFTDEKMKTRRGARGERATMAGVRVKVGSSSVRDERWAQRHFNLPTPEIGTQNPATLCFRGSGRDRLWWGNFSNVAAKQLLKPTRAPRRSGLVTGRGHWPGALVVFCSHTTLNAL